MSHEQAKHLLASANTVPQRVAAIKAALRLGMPLAEIEAFLDACDAAQGNASPGDPPDPPPNETCDDEPSAPSS